MKTRSILCASHFLKNLVIKVKGTPATKKVRKCFIFMFALIQNSKTIGQLDDVLKRVFIIFNRKVYDQHVTSSIQYLRYLTFTFKL